jgi:polyferredoxin
MPIFSGWTFLEWFTPLPLFTQALAPFRVGISWTHAGVAIFILSVIFSVVSEKRAWCRYICPLGAVLSLPSAFKFLRISLNKNKCINCSKCDEQCTMGVLDVGNQSGLRWDSECILCMTCRDTCPTNAIGASYAHTQ